MVVEWANHAAPDGAAIGVSRDLYAPANIENVIFQECTVSNSRRAGFGVDGDSTTYTVQNITFLDCDAHDNMGQGFAGLGGGLFSETKVPLRNILVRGGCSYRNNLGQRLTFDNAQNGGTFRLSYDGSETENITYSSNAVTLSSSIKRALEPLANVGSGKVEVFYYPNAGASEQSIRFIGGVDNTVLVQVTYASRSGSVTVWRGYHNPADEGGGGKWMITSGFIMDDFEAYENVGPGVWGDFYNSGYLITDVRSHDNLGSDDGSNAWQGQGITTEINNPAFERPGFMFGYVDSSTVYGNAGAGIMIAETDSVVVENTTLTDNGLLFRWVSGRPAPKNVFVYGNTFSGSAIGAYDAGFSSTDPLDKNIWFDDNIYTGRQSGDTLIAWAGQTYSDTNLTTLRNLGWELRCQLT